MKLFGFMKYTGVAALAEPFNLRHVDFGFAFGATVLTYLLNGLGGWDKPLNFLIMLSIADYVSGFLAAARHKRLNSDVMFWGGIRKGYILVVLLIAVQADHVFNGGDAVFRTMAIYFYISRELISVFENSSLLGVNWPQPLVDFFTQLKQNTPETGIDAAANKFAKHDEQVAPISQEVSLPASDHIIQEETIEKKAE